MKAGRSLTTLSVPPTQCCQEFENSKINIDDT